MEDKRTFNFKKNKISKCPYCGSAINIRVEFFSIYWQMKYFKENFTKIKVPSNKVNLYYDQLGNKKVKKPPINYKSSNAFKKSFIQPPNNKKPFINNKCNTYFIIDGMLVCDCLLSTGCITKNMSANILSYKPGYDWGLVEKRQIIINSKNRRS